MHRNLIRFEYDTFQATKNKLDFGHVDLFYGGQVVQHGGPIDIVKT